MLSSSNFTEKVDLLKMVTNEKKRFLNLKKVNLEEDSIGVLLICYNKKWTEFGWSSVF
jgi:hypothetical protein